MIALIILALWSVLGALWAFVIAPGSQFPFRHPYLTVLIEGPVVWVIAWSQR